MSNTTTEPKKNDKVEWMFAKHESERFGIIREVDSRDSEMVWVAWENGSVTYSLLGSIVRLVK